MVSMVDRAVFRCVTIKKNNFEKLRTNSWQQIIVTAKKSSIEYHTIEASINEIFQQMIVEGKLKPRNVMLSKT